MTSPQRILVVEDEPLIAMMIEDALTRTRPKIHRSIPTLGMNVAPDSGGYAVHPAAAAPPLVA